MCFNWCLIFYLEICNTRLKKHFRVCKMLPSFLMSFTSISGYHPLQLHASPRHMETKIPPLICLF